MVSTLHFRAEPLSSNPRQVTVFPKFLFAFLFCLIFFANKLAAFKFEFEGRISIFIIVI